MTYLMLELGIAGTKEVLKLQGVPFQVARNEGRVAPVAYGHKVEVGKAVECLFFLGMTTQAPSGETGWSGERFYGYQRKLFLGDVIGRIHLLYDDNLMVAVPLIFGVNVWNYETFSSVQPHEGPVSPMFGPYREPFDSDVNARALFKASLVLCENEHGEKYTKYGLAFKVRPRYLQWLWLRPWGAREAGIGISAVTASEVDAPPPTENTGWQLTDEWFYVQRRYFPALDRMARRLYQYLDDLPEHFLLDKPSDYRGPHIELTGTRQAELLTNVYYHNLHDMATNKVEEGKLHTSTRDNPMYGFYAGIGTYRKEGQHNYYDQVWSRDLGRLLCELIEHGECERCIRAGEVLLGHLYDRDPAYPRPHWKRIVNAAELGVWPESYDGISFQEYVRGRENDGHAAVMLMLYRLWQHRCVGVDFLRAHWQQMIDAAEWFCWQMDNPMESGFDEVLCSESESTYEWYGGYDLYSNSYAHAALLTFARLARAVDEGELEARWQTYAERLWTGIESAFITDHPRFGRVLCEPESDNWPSELKRMASLLLLPEIAGYDPAEVAPQWVALWTATYRAQKEQFFSPMVGGSMGYGQGYTTQTALLLDEVEDYTQCLDWAARFSYHHTEYPYIVPEGVTYHPSGRFWYRHTDLGNAVQQTEIVKCVRLVLGLDDLCPEAGLRLVPRLPDGWRQILARDYPVVARCEDGIARVPINWRYVRDGDGFAASFESERPVRVASVRLGPYSSDPPRLRLEGFEAEVAMKQRGSRTYAYVRLDREVQRFELRGLVLRD